MRSRPIFAILALASLVLAGCSHNEHRATAEAAYYEAQATRLANPVPIVELVAKDGEEITLGGVQRFAVFAPNNGPDRIEQYEAGPHPAVQIFDTLVSAAGPAILGYKGLETIAELGLAGIASAGGNVSIGGDQIGGDRVDDRSVVDQSVSIGGDQIGGDRIDDQSTVIGDGYTGRDRIDDESIVIGDEFTGRDRIDDRSVGRDQAGRDQIDARQDTRIGRDDVGGDQRHGDDIDNRRGRIGSPGENRNDSPGPIDDNSDNSDRSDNSITNPPPQPEPEPDPDPDPSGGG